MPQSKDSKSNYIVNESANSHEQTQINQYSSIKIKNLKSAKQVLDNMHESESDDESSEISSFLLDKDEFRNQSLMNDPRTNSTYLISSQIDCVNNSHCNLNFLGPEAQIKLAQLFEEAGLKHLSPDDGKGADPEILRQLTSSVNCALEEAVAALTLTRIKSGTSKGVQTPDDQANLDALHQRALESLEEGESLLSLACSSGYYELVQVLLAMNTSIEERGIKGDTTPLMEAASGGYYEIVKLLLEHGADPKAQSLSGNTALTYSCIGGHTEVARLLLKYGAEVEHQNENGHTALMEAATGGHVETARILVTEGRASINAHSNEFKESALTLACYKGNLEMVRFLLEAGADHEHKTEEMHTALMEASMDGHLEVAKLLLDHGAQVNMPPDSFESPLTLAACGGHVELANLLIERGANLEEINDEGYTPLMEAAREGHKDVVSLLLSHGSNVNAQTEETQETALTLACYGGFLQVADLLIKTGADIELGCNTPLMEASQEGHLDLVHYLLLAGANPHAQTGPGNTALTFAAENGHTDIVVLLLHYGAEIDHESEGGKTPLIKAARNGHAAVVKLLVENGANPNKTTTNNEHTALSLAAYAGHIIIVELLLEYGADPTHKLKDNSTALIEASKNGHTDIVQLLLDFPKFLKQINSESASAATPSLLLEKQTLKLQQQQQLQHLQHLKQLQTHQQLQQQQLLLLKEKKQFAAQQLEHLQQQQKQLLTQQHQQDGPAPNDSLKQATLQLASSPTDNAELNDTSNNESGKGVGGNETSVIVMTTDASWQADSCTHMDAGDKSYDAAILKLASDVSLYQSFEHFQNQVASNAVPSMHAFPPSAFALPHDHQQQTLSTTTSFAPSIAAPVGTAAGATFPDAGNYNLQSLAATKGMALRIGDKIRHLKDLLRNNFDLASLLGDVNEGAADAFHREMHTTDKWAHSINAAVRKIERYIVTAQQRQQLSLQQPQSPHGGPNTQPAAGAEMAEERIVEGREGDAQDARQQVEESQAECEETEEEEDDDNNEPTDGSVGGEGGGNDGGDEDVLVSFTPEQLDSRLRMQQAQFDRLRRLQLQQQAAAQQRYLLLAASAAAAQTDGTGVAVGPRYDFNALRALAGAPGFLKTSEVEIEKIPNQQGGVPPDQSDKGEPKPDSTSDRAKESATLNDIHQSGPLLLAAPPPPLCICDGKIVTLLPSHHFDTCSIHGKSNDDKVEAGGGVSGALQQRCSQPSSTSPGNNKVVALAQRPQYYLPPYSLPFDSPSIYDVTTSSEIVKLKNINASLSSSTFLPTLPTGPLGAKGSDPYSTSYSISLINNQYDIDIGKFGLDNLLDITEIEDLSNGLDMSQSAQFLDQQHSQQPPGGLEAACCQLLHLNGPDAAHQIFNRTGPSYYPGPPGQDGLCKEAPTNPIPSELTTGLTPEEESSNKSHSKSPTSTASLCYHAAAAAHHHHHPFLNFAAAADLQRQQQQQQQQFQHVAQLHQQYFAGARVAPPPPLFSHHLHHHLHHLPPYATNNVNAVGATIGQQAAALNFNNVLTALQQQQPHLPLGPNASAAANKKSVAPATSLAFEKCCNYQAASSLVQKLYDRAAPSALEANQSTAQREELPQASPVPEVEELTCGKQSQQQAPPTAAPVAPCTPTSAVGTGKKYYPAIEVDAQTDSNHDTALTLACAGGPPELVELLIKRGSSIEHRDKKGFTPLIIAATSGQANIVQLLLNHGVNIEAQSDRTKDTALSLACSSGRYEVVEVLLNNGAYIEHRNVSDYTPLSLAASGGHCNIIKLLLNHGAEINSRTGSKLGISPLMLAAMNGHLAAVKLLLDMGSDINAQIETNKNTALTLACFQGKHEVVSLFLEYKANIEHRAKTGLTPLMEAASGGFVDVGRVLIEKGADVNAAPVPSSRDTALTIAADKGHYKFVELLVQNGAQIEVKNKKGNSPLWLAANGGHLDVIQYLAQKGADIDSQDNRKVSCLMAAFKKGHIRTVRWMVKHVSQFPSDTECKRFNNTLVDKDMLKRCHQCMEIIIWAKDRQAAEANKNALDLLDELDKEKTREENKKAAAARRREKKRQKKKDKQVTNPDPKPGLDDGTLAVEEKASTSSNSSTVGTGAGDKACSTSSALRESVIQDAIARMDAVSLDDRVSSQEEGSTRKMSVLESWFVRKFNLKAPMLSSKPKAKTQPPDGEANREMLAPGSETKKAVDTVPRQSEKRLIMKKHSTSRHQQGKEGHTNTVSQAPSSLLALNYKKASSASTPIAPTLNTDPDSSSHHASVAPSETSLKRKNNLPPDNEDDGYENNQNDDGGDESETDDVGRDYASAYHTTANTSFSHNRYTGLVALTSTSDNEQRWSSTNSRDAYSKNGAAPNCLRQDEYSDHESNIAAHKHKASSFTKPGSVAGKRTSTAVSSSDFKTIMLRKKKSGARSHFRDRSSDPNSASTTNDSQRPVVASSSPPANEEEDGAFEHNGKQQYYQNQSSSHHRSSNASRHKHGSHAHHHHNLFPAPPYYAAPLEPDDFGSGGYYDQQPQQRGGEDDIYHVAYGRNSKNMLASTSASHHHKPSSGTGSGAHHVRKQHYHDDSDIPSSALGYGGSSSSHHHQGRSWNGTSATSTGKRSSDALLSSSLALPPFGSCSHSSDFNEDEWKEVVRKCKRVVVASNVVARVIGRGGQNINAIRDMSGAHIEIDKQKGAADRNITIRGSPEAIKFAYQLIMALVDEPDRDAMEIIQSYESLKPSSKLPAILQKSNLLSFANHQIVLKGAVASTLPSRYIGTSTSFSVATSSTALTTTTTCVSSIPSLVSITYRTNKSQTLPTSPAVVSSALASTATVVSTTLQRSSPSPSNNDTTTPVISTTIYSSLSLTVTCGASELGTNAPMPGTCSSAAVYKDFTDSNQNSFSGAWGFFTLPSHYSNNRDAVSQRGDLDRLDDEEAKMQNYGNNHHNINESHDAVNGENSIKTPIPHHTPAHKNDNIEHPVSAPTAEYSPFNTFVNTMFPSSVWCKKEATIASSSGHNLEISSGYSAPRGAPSSALGPLGAAHDKGPPSGGNSSLAFKAANFASIVASPHPNAVVPSAAASSYPAPPPSMSNAGNSPSLSHHHHLPPTSEPNTPPEEDLRKAPGYKRNMAVKSLVMCSNPEITAHSSSTRIGDLLRGAESPCNDAGEFASVLGLSAPTTPLVGIKYQQQRPSVRAPSSSPVVREMNEPSAVVTNFKPISGGGGNNNNFANTFRDDCLLISAPSNHSSVVGGGGDSSLSALNLINSFSQPSDLMLSAKVVSSKKHPAPIGNERVSHKNTNSMDNSGGGGGNKYTPWSLGSDAPALNDWYNQSLLSLGRSTTSSANSNPHPLTTTSSGGGVYSDLNFNPETFFLQNSQGFFNNASSNTFPSYNNNESIGEFVSTQKASGKYGKDNNSATASDILGNNNDPNNINNNNLSNLQTHNNAFTNNLNIATGLPSFNSSFAPLNLTAGGAASAFKDIKANQNHPLPPLFAPPPHTLSNPTGLEQHSHMPPTNFSMYSPHPFFNSLPPPFLAPPQGGSGPHPPPLGAPPHNLLNNLNSLFQQHQQNQNNNNQGAVAAAAAFFLNNPAAAAAQLYPPSFKSNNPHGIVNLGGPSDFNGAGLGIMENGLGLDDTTTSAPGLKKSLGAVSKQTGGSNPAQGLRYGNAASANNNVGGAALRSGGNNGTTINQSSKPQLNLGAGLMNGFNFGGLDAGNVSMPNNAANYGNFFNQAFNGSNPPPGAALNLNNLWNEQFKMVAALASNAAAACNNNAGGGGSGGNDFSSLQNLPPPFPPGVLPSFGNMPGAPSANSPFDPKLLNWNTWNSNV